eukprot:scaffold103276_cov69-Phaeocystis_antarctica.AAC.1
MENWVADSKRGPLRHTPTGSAATLNQWKSEKMLQRHPVATDPLHTRRDRPRGHKTRLKA